MGKGGGGGHTPYEAPESGRSKQRIKIVEIISEGEIQGLKEGVKSVYLDKTPVQNADGSYNFRNMELQGTIGSQEQDIMRGFNTSEREVPVGVEVKKNAPIVRTINDSKVNRLRITVGVRSLFEQKENGDTVGTTVNLLIRVGDSERQVTISGKYSAQYLRQIVIDNLPATPFNVTVLRVEADSTKQRLQNATIWSSYTEIIDTEFAYPNTALAGLMFDSEYFSNLPQRNYLVRGIKVKVPSNYDPISRSYNGLWDGRFKIAWTNNPAWIFYDLMTNKRYGMGQRLGDFGVDKWALYAIAQYCDVSVPDGFGGTEPRMTCNCWLTEQRQAYDLINDLASIFRAMPVWNGQQLTAIQDRPSDPVWTYTNANVVNGEFERGYSALKARHNIIHVEYLDKNDFFEKKIEYVSDDESVKRYGANVKKVTAFGCTSRGQAYRLGRWILETEKLEKETITFSVGREGLMHLPGDIIRIADNHYAGTNIGGRVLAINGRKVTLDRDITLSGEMYLSYINAEARQQTIKISSVNRNVVTLGSTPTGLTEFSVWALTTSAVRSGLYRAVSISENENGSYTITALQHEPQKEAVVDNGAHFEEVSKTLYSAPQLTDVVIDASNGFSANIRAEMTAGNAIITRYDILIYQGEKLYQSYIGQKTAEVKLDNLPNGEYSVLIIAKDEKGRVLSERNKTFTIDRPPAPAGVTVTGGLENIVVTWDYVDDVTQTEIFCAEVDDINAAKRIVKVSETFMFNHQLAPAQVRYYWLRHTRGQNIGPFYQEQGLRGETAEDINSTLDKLREELSENIIDEVIDTAIPARNLELVKTVSEIPAKHNGHNTLYNTADGKQYTWNGTQYTSTVPVSDITGLIPVSKLSGQLQDNQIATLSASKLTGTVAQNKIDPSFVSKVTANTSAIAAETAARTKAVQDEATARTAAINTEIRNRANAIKVESDKLTKAIQAEATTRGTAVTELQNTDKAQAESIKQVTAKADNALSGLSEERNARIAGDQVQAQARNALTTRIATAESNIATIQQSVTTQSQAISNVSQNLNAKIDGLSTGGNLLPDTELINGMNEHVTRMRVDKDLTYEIFRRNGINTVRLKRHNALSKETNVEFARIPISRGKIYQISIYCRYEAKNIAIYQINSPYVRLLNRDMKFTSQGVKTKFIRSGMVPQHSPTWENLSDFYRFVVNVDLTSAVDVEYLSIACRSGASVATPDEEDWLYWCKPMITEIKSINAPEMPYAIGVSALSIAKVSADLTDHKKTQASINSAMTIRLQTAEAEIGTNIGKITQLSQAQATTNGKLQTTHTIKTEAISGGKLAIAGISLGAGADSTTAESSVIVMADKFSIVKNKADSNPVPVFTVMGGKTVLKGDLIASGAITSDKLATNSVSAGAIQSGAIRAEHVAAGELTADKLAIGLGGNLLYNPIFSNDCEGWIKEGYNNVTNINFEGKSDTWVDKQVFLPTEQLALYRFNCDNRSINNGDRVFYLGQRSLPVIKGKSYIFSAYASAHRCKVRLIVDLRNSTGGYPNTFYSQYARQNFRHSLDNADRLFVKFDVPTTNDVVKADFYIMCEKDGTYDNSILFAMRPMLEECTQYTREPSPWQNSGVTAIHGGSIKTGTVVADKLAANSVTAEKIVSGSVTSSKIASNSINAGHIVSKSVTADKIGVASLSAISANLGNITGGSLNINNRFKVNGSGDVEIRGASGNVGMVIRNERIDVYDEKGVLKVRLGRL